MVLHAWRRNRPTMQFSVVVLNYNGMKFLKDCLSSLITISSPHSFEIICADNGSSDGSFEQAMSDFSSTTIRFIQNGGNYGYAEGNDLAAKTAVGKIIVFLNNDTVVAPNFLDDLSTVFQDSNVGVAQSRLVTAGAAGVVESLGHKLDIFALAYVDGGMPHATEPYHSGKRIFGATGAAIAIRRHLFDELGGFDPSYFLMFEETDLCWRAWLAGFDVVLADNSVVYHKGRGSIGMNPLALRLMVRNRLTSIMKNAGWPLLPVMLGGNITAMVTLALYYLLTAKSKLCWAIVSGIGQAVLRVPYAIEQRASIQRTRSRADSFLFRNGYLIFPSMYALKNLKAFS